MKEEWERGPGAPPGERRRSGDAGRVGEPDFGQSGSTGPHISPGPRGNGRRCHGPGVVPERCFDKAVGVPMRRREFVPRRNCRPRQVVRPKDFFDRLRTGGRIVRMRSPAV